MVNRNLNLPPYKPIEIEFLSKQKVAASKRYNHLYIALKSSIRVYNPAYPTQTVSPTLPYTTLVSDPPIRGVGYIDPWEPHAINSLTVGELGFEEVLVSAHDDGDVCVWYTRDLSKLAFRVSVGESAWGVALHKEQRLLAVSANNHLIQVFELADRGGKSKNMTGPEEAAEADLRCQGEEDVGRQEKRRRGLWPLPDLGAGSRGNPPEHPAFSSTSSVVSPFSNGKKHRKKSPVRHNRVRTLDGHNYNIPNISFLDDPSGRWLVGTSIDGMVILWDILTERPVEKCRMGYSNRGWSVLFLKPQAFKPVSNIYEALGKPLPPHYDPRAGGEGPPKASINEIRTFSTDYYDPIPGSPAQASRGAKAWDISPDSSRTMSGMNAFYHFITTVSPESVFSDGGYEEDQWSEGDADTDLEAHNNETLLLLGDEGSGGDSNYLSSPENGAHYELRGVPSLEESGVVTFDQFSELLQDSDSSRSSRNNSSKRSRSTSRGYRDGLYSAGRSSASGDSTPALSDTEDDDEDPAQPPTSLIFSTTEHNAHLLTVTSSLTPIVVCRSPVHSRSPSASQHSLANIDRLNLCHVIPDLSLVIAASQKGRIAIFRLTRVGDVFAMRLDNVLPRDGEPGQPNASLLGVAVGPVQGREIGTSTRSRRGGWRGVEGRRRYRLMCVFVDGTVVSYELGREKTNELVMA